MIVVVLAAAGCNSDPRAAKIEQIRKGDDFFAAKRFPEAVLAYRNALHHDERDAGVHFKLAETYAAQSDVRNALPAYVRAADLDPDNIDAQLKAGNLLLLSRQYEDANTRARAVLRKDPANAAALLMLGNALAGARNLDEAVAVNERAAALDPTRPGILLNLGALQFIRGNTAEAEAAFRKAIEVDPRSLEAYSGFASYYWATANVREAERALLRALELDSNHLPAHRQLAALYMSSGRSLQAESHLLRVVAIANTPASKVALSEYYLVVGRVSQAIALMESLAAHERTFGDAKIRIALMQYVIGRRAEAQQSLDDVLVREPANANAMAIKAHMLMDDDRLPAAQALAEAAIRANPQSPRGHFALGKALARQGRLGDARLAFQHAVHVDANATEAYIEMAALYLRRNEVSSAIRAAEKAVSSNPRSVDARLARVRALSLRAEDRRRAEEELQVLMRVVPGSADAHHAMGELALANNDMKAARTAFERALELDGTSFESLDALIGMDVRGKRLKEARRRLDAALARKPRSAPLLMLAGRTYAAAGDPRGAEQAIRKAIEIDPRSPEGYTALAALYLVERRLDDARREFMTIAERQSHSVAPATMVGILSEALGDQGGAIQWYERALRIDPRAGTAANNLAWLYVQNGEKLDEALYLAQTAASELPTIPEVSDTLAWVYYKKDLAALALPILQRLVDQEPRNALYHFHLGMVYAKRGEDLKARAAIERALALKPEFTGAAEARRMLESLRH